MSKFKVGDRVMVIGTISGTVIDVKSNGVVVECDEPSNGVEICQYPNKMVLWPNESQVELIAPSRYELHITCSDGKTTNAVYKVNGKIEKRAEAVCAPSDTFDFATGAQTAFDRVFPKATPTQPIAPQEDKPKYKSGDRVKVVADTNFNRIVGEMVTLKTVFQNTSGSWYWSIAEKRVYIRESDIEPYAEPEKEPDPVYYSGKVVCVDDGGYSDLYTAGKIYVFTDGRMTNNQGTRSNSFHKCETFAELETNFSAKFIPYLGEA